jgi:hypothetical protein
MQVIAVQKLSHTESFSAAQHHPENGGASARFHRLYFLGICLYI